MKNRITAAGTTAQQSFKCSLLLRPALLLAIPLLCAVFCQAQEFKIMKAGTMPSNISMMADSLKILRVYDSVKGEVAIYYKDSLIVMDSLAAIKTLLKISQYSFEQQQKQNEKYWAAQDILNYINTQGYVMNKDRKKFNEAVSKYRKLTNQKGKAEKMQKLDILIRDVNGKALGWVSQ